MISLQNPFFTGGYVAPEYFCDREKETENLLKHIRNDNNISLISTRRMGKTGLLRHCFGNAAIKNHYIPFFVDIYATKSLNDFVFLLSKTIFIQLKTTSQKLMESFLMALKSIRPEISFDEHGVPTLALGIGDIRKPESSLDDIFQFLQRHIMGEMFNSAAHPFFASASTMYLGKVTDWNCQRRQSISANFFCVCNKTQSYFSQLSSSRFKRIV